MCRIMINAKCKQYKKEDTSTKCSINNAMLRLYEKIKANGDNINSIYNNDSIVYDRINDSIFIYKTHGNNNAQLRIVYAYMKNKEESIIYLIDYTLKKKNNKEYIYNMNNKFKNTKLSEMIFNEVVC